MKNSTRCIRARNRCDKAWKEYKTLGNDCKDNPELRVAMIKADARYRIAYEAWDRAAIHLEKEGDR